MAIGFCEQNNCNFSTEFDCLIVDPFANHPSPSIEKTVSDYIKGANDVGIYFNVNEQTNEFRFSFPLYIFIDKNLSIKKLDGQISPKYIEFAIDRKHNYLKTGVYISDLLVSFDLLGFSRNNNQLILNEFSYFIDSGKEHKIFQKLDYCIEISGYKIGLCQEILFNFIQITLKDPAKEFILQIYNKLNSTFSDGKINLTNDNNSVSVIYNEQQKIVFTSLDIFSVLDLIADNVSSLQKLPNINTTSIYKINIRGGWPDGDMDQVNNFLSVPLKTELDLNGKISIYTKFVPFNMNGKCMNLYFSLKNTKIIGKIISIKETRLYVFTNKYKKKTVSILRHETGKILIFDSNITLTVNYLKYNFVVNDSFPVSLALSNTEIAHVKILKTDFNQITEPVKYLSLINIMDRNPVSGMHFILDGKNYFIEMPFTSFYYFVALTVLYDKYSNIVHGFKNGINCLSVKYDVKYDRNISLITTTGQQPTDMPVVLCIGDIDECDKMGFFYYYVTDSLHLGQNEYVSSDFIFYNVYIHSNNVTYIGLSDLDTFYNHFQFFLNGAKIDIIFPDDPAYVQNCTIINGTIVADTDFFCDDLVFVDVKCLESITLTFDCYVLHSDLHSLPLIYQSSNIDQLEIFNAIDFSLTIDITDEDLIINGVKIQWKLVRSITIYGYEFILNNKATEISGFTVIAVSDNTVVQFYGDYKELTIDKSITISSPSFSAIIYVYQPYLNPSIYFDLGYSYQFVLSYMDVVSYCIYVYEETNYSYCPNTYEKMSYLDLNSCANTNATRIELYFNDEKPTSNVFGLLDLNLFKSKELYLFCSNDYIRLNVTLPKDQYDLDYTSVTFQNLLIYVQYEYEGQHLLTHFGYLSMMVSGFMNAENVSVIVDHFYGRFYNLRDWKNITINKECYLYDFNTIQPYSVHFVPQMGLKNRLNLYLKDTDHDRLIIFGNMKIYYNNGVYYLPSFDFEVNIFVTDPYHTIEFNCNETGDIPNLNIVFHSCGPVYFTGLWHANENYIINLSIDRDVAIVIEYLIYMNIDGTGSPTIYGGTLDCVIFGEIVLTITDLESPISLGLSSVFPGNLSKITINSLKYKFLKYHNRFFTAAVMLGTGIFLIIVELGYEGVKQNGFNFIYYMDNFGVSQVSIMQPIKGMKLDDEINVYLNFTGNLDNEEDYKILRQNLSLLIAPSDNTYYDFKLYMIIDKNSLTHGFTNVTQLKKISQYKPGFSNFVLYTVKSPLEVPYVVQFAINGVFLKNIDVGISQYQKIDTAFDSVPNLIKQISFIVSSVIPINYPIITSSIDSRYKNITFFVATTLNESDTIYVDEIGTGIATLKIKNIKLKKQGKSNNYKDNVQNLYMSDSEIDIDVIDDFENIENINADVDSFNKFIQMITFTGKTNATVTGVKGIRFGEEFWYIRAHKTSSLPSPKIEAKQFKSMTVEALDDVELTITNEINQTVISGLNVLFIPNKSRSFFNLKLGIRWKNILDMSCLSIYSEVPINILTMSLPINCQITSPSLTINFDPESKEQFHLSNSVISDSFEMNLTRFPPNQQVVIGNSTFIKNNVNITFVDEIGQIYTNELVILPDSNVSIYNISVNNSIIISPGSSLELEELVTNNGTIIELHWNSSAFPLLEFNSLISAENISLILDDKKPDINVMNALLYNNPRIILSGVFDCEKWQWKINMLSNSQYYRSGKDNVLSLRCKKSNDIWRLYLYSYKNVTIQSNAQQTEKGSDVPLIAGLTSAAIVIVGIISVSFYYLFRDSREVRLRERRKELRRKEKRDKKFREQQLKMMKKASSSSFDDLTSCSFSESSETEEKIYPNYSVNSLQTISKVVDLA